MLYERIESPGLAHYSYIVGDGGEAGVIDPRRDAEIYIDRARRQGCRITTVVETHRNEDHVVGSAELAARTGADVWHADGQLDHRYGRPAEPGQTWGIETVTAGELCDRLDGGHGPSLLDVRSDRQVAGGGSIWGALRIPLGELGRRLGEVPRDGPVCVVCGAGLRSMTAASLLRAAGHEQITVMLGGLGAWNSTTCPVRLEAAGGEGDT